MEIHFWLCKYFREFLVCTADEFRENMALYNSINSGVPAALQTADIQELYTKLSFLEHDVHSTLRELAADLSRACDADIFLHFLISELQSYSYNHSDASRMNNREERRAKALLLIQGPRVFSSDLEDWNSAFYGSFMAIGIPDLEGKMLGYLIIFLNEIDSTFSSDLIQKIDQTGLIISFLCRSYLMHFHDIHSLERAYMAIESNNLGVWDTNLRTGQTYFNDRFGTMLGYDPKELEPKFTTLEHLIHPDDYDQSIRAFHDHLSGMTDFYEVEHRVRCKNNKWRWMLCKGRVIERDESGVAVRALGIQYDINRLKALQDQNP